MWVLPEELKTSFLSAQDWVDSKEELDEVAFRFEQCVTWKGKPSSSQTWLRAWKRVFWIKHLFGQTLKPSMEKCFTEWWTGSLVDTPVNRFPPLEREVVKTTLATYGLTFELSFQMYDLIGAFLKMFQVTSLSDTNKSKASWKNWAMKLRREYTQRLKLARLTEENVCSSLQWPTPDTFDKGNANINQKSNRISGPKNYLQALSWPTPTVAEAGKIGNRANFGQIALSNHPAIVGLPTRAKALKGDGNAGRVDRENNKTFGKNPEQLNPAWVAQLMGTTLEKIFFVPWVTL